MEQMANAIEPILNLASATQNDLAFATDTVIATLNQFQLDSSEAGRVSNVFASAIGYSQATLDKLGYSLSYVGPVANSLGWELESTVGALSVLYNAGYDGSMAGTSLRQSLVALMNPTASAKRIFEELGLELKDLDPTTNDFADIVDRLKNSGMSTAASDGGLWRESRSWNDGFACTRWTGDSGCDRGDNRDEFCGRNGRKAGQYHARFCQIDEIHV